MFNSVVISIAITLVFIFLLMAVMVTAINELVFTFMRSRSKHLEAFLAKLYFDDEKWKEIFNKVKNSPFINVLKKAPEKFPGSIPAETFTTALLAHIGKNELTIEAVKKASEENKDSQSDFYVMLRALLSQNPTFEQLRAEIDKMFNSAMDRLSGWYKRNAKIWSFFVALLLCCVLNVDTITITRNLWNDKDKAEQLASFAVAAGKYFEKNDSSEVVMKNGIDTLAYIRVENKALTESKVGKAIGNIPTTDTVHKQQLQTSYNILAKLDVPIGWSKDNVPAKSDSGMMTIGLWLLKILGLLLTTAAVSLGAPYWFDILNKITPLKQATGKTGGSDTGGTSK
jgi:hypothetical protein